MQFCRANWHSLSSFVHKARLSIAEPSGRFVGLSSREELLPHTITTDPTDTESNSIALVPAIQNQRDAKRRGILEHGSDILGRLLIMAENCANKCCHF